MWFWTLPHTFHIILNLLAFTSRWSEHMPVSFSSGARWKYLTDSAYKVDLAPVWCCAWAKLLDGATYGLLIHSQLPEMGALRSPASEASSACCLLLWWVRFPMNRLNCSSFSHITLFFPICFSAVPCWRSVFFLWKFPEKYVFEGRW